MLTDGDLEAMRSALGELLPDTCNILAATTSVDGQGGVTQVWGTAQAGIPCRLDPGRKETNESARGGALQPYSQWYLTLRYDAVIGANSRVEHGGYVYNVVGADPGKSWTGTVRATVVRV